jgi:ribosomal protein L11 methyltransferase
MRKSWVELQVEIPALLIEPVSNFLMEQGSTGIIEKTESPRKKKNSKRLTAYFPNDSAFRPVPKKLKIYLSSLGTLHCSSFSFQTRVIREEKWAEAWKENFKPLHVTSNLVIKPPWEKYRAREKETVIEIDPGMAFGTGTHATTQMCLRELDKIIPSLRKPPSILDVGTGSGILAIAARKFGAEKILALDIDPVAIECALQNAEANQVKDGIDFRVGSIAGLRRVFDIVVANLLPQELLKLTSSLAKRISSRGVLVISGILRGQKREIVNAFIQQGLKVLHAIEDKGWVCCVFKKRRERI